MLIEALAPLRVKADGKRFALWPGQVVDLSPFCATRLLERAPGKVRAVAATPLLSLEPRIRITWQGPDGRERNGLVDFIHTYPGEGWAFCTLSDGKWTAVNVKYILKREHGYDGAGPLTRGGQH